MSPLFGNKKQEYDPEPAVTDKMPVAPYRVVRTDIPFYSDAGGTEQVEEARIITLKALDPDLQIGDEEVVPTRKKYKAGQLVTWQVNTQHGWGDSWYRDSQTEAIKKAWTFHVEFQGEVLSEKVIQENRAEIEELEKNLTAREAEKLAGPAGKSESIN